MMRAELPDRTGEDLSPRQRTIIEVIRDSAERDGYPPPLREIGEATGLTSTSSVSHQLSMLEKKGYLSRGPGRPRTAVVCPLPALSPAGEQQAGQAHGDVERQGIARVPLVGRIAAGRPILAAELVEDIMPLPRQL